MTLFVNVAGYSYSNLFRWGQRYCVVCTSTSPCSKCTGRRVLLINWFSSSTQREGSPVIQRLLNAPKASALPPSPPSPPPGTTAVLLFCRLPQQPYVYCGRLGYYSHSLGVSSNDSPVEILWQLLDEEALMKSELFAETLASLDGEERLSEVGVYDGY